MAARRTGAGFSTRQHLVSVGRPRALGDERVRSGAWVRAAPSVYLTRPQDLGARVRAALAHAGPGGTVTGWAACRLLGLPFADDLGSVDVLVPHGRRRVSTPCVRLVQTTRPPELVHVMGSPVAVPVRAVCDAARRLTELRAVRAVVLGAHDRVSPEALAAELRAGPRRGNDLLRRAVLDAERGAWSAPEAEIADLVEVAVRAGRLPGFHLNPDLYLDGRFIGIPDGYLVGTGVGWESDSRKHHGDEDALDATLDRAGAFTELGLGIVHVTPRRSRGRPQALVDRLIGTVASHTEPPGLVVVPRVSAAGRPR